MPMTSPFSVAVLLADDRQFDGATVKTRVEDDGLATGGRRKRGTKRDRSLGWHLDVFETVDHDGFMVDVATDKEEGNKKNCKQSELMSHIGPRGTRYSSLSVLEQGSETVPGLAAVFDGQCDASFSAARPLLALLVSASWQ